jgi:uncharacterized protein
MTHEEKAAYIAYRIEKAELTYQDAVLLADHKSWNACANRLYYASFYAVTALLLQNGYETQTHKGVKTLLGEHFVKTGKIDVGKGRFYSQLFDKRQAGDYADLLDWTEEDILPLIEPTKDFIEVIKDLINS